MGRLFPDDYRLWVAVVILTFAPLTLLVHFWRLARHAWLAPTSHNIFFVALVFSFILALAWTAGWVACFLTPEFGIRLTRRPNRSAFEDYDDSMLPPFLIPVPPDPPPDQPQP
jgi:hypothetical protein